MKQEKKQLFIYTAIVMITMIVTAGFIFFFQGIGDQSNAQSNSLTEATNNEEKQQSDSAKQSATKDQDDSEETDSNKQSTSQNKDRIDDLKSNDPIDGTKFTFTNPEDVAKKLLDENKNIPIENLWSAVPKNAKNEFYTSKNIDEGYKYNYKMNGMSIQIKWHSPDRNAAEKFPGSNSGNMWTAQISVNGKLLGQDGKYYSNPSNETHIPIDYGGDELGKPLQ